MSKHEYVNNKEENKLENFLTKFSVLPYLDRNYLFYLNLYIFNTDATLVNAGT